MEDTDIKSAVRKRYAQAALSVAQGAEGSCCTGTPGQAQCCNPITGNLYEAGQVGELPETAVLASLAIGDGARRRGDGDGMFLFVQHILHITP